MRVLTFLFLGLVQLSPFGSLEAYAHSPEIEALLSKVSPTAPTDTRVEMYSAALLGKPYLLGPLGEGPGAKYDQNPLYRLDAFDCTTFIETVLSLTLSKSTEDFEKNLKSLRYHNGKVDFTERNHFPDLDWMPHNLEAQILEEDTKKFASDLPVKTAEVQIDKSEWYKSLPASRIQVEGLSSEKASALLNSLHAEGARFAPEKASVAYISFGDIFKKVGLGYEARANFFATIPSGTFFNLVIRRAPKKTVGTGLLIWHQGLFIRKNNELVIRHASNLSRRVVEVPAADYLLYEFLSHKFDGGIDSGLSLFRIKAH